MKYKAIDICSTLLTTNNELQLTLRMLRVAKEAGYTNVWDKEYGSDNYTDHSIDVAIKSLETGHTLQQFVAEDWDEDRVEHPEIP